MFVVERARIFVDHSDRRQLSHKGQTIEREVQLKPGDALSLSAVQESQRRLAASSCSAAPALPSSGTATRRRETCSSPWKNPRPPR